MEAVRPCLTLLSFTRRRPPELREEGWSALAIRTRESHTLPPSQLPRATAIHVSSDLGLPRCQCGVTKCDSLHRTGTQRLKESTLAQAGSQAARQGHILQGFQPRAQSTTARRLRWPGGLHGCLQTARSMTTPTQLMPGVRRSSAARHAAATTRPAGTFRSLGSTRSGCQGKTDRVHTSARQQGSGARRTLTQAKRSRCRRM